MKYVFIVSIPDDSGFEIDSVWNHEEAALRRAQDVGTRCFIDQYRTDKAEGWVRNGWHPPMKDPPCWSDWSRTDAKKGS